MNAASFQIQIVMYFSPVIYQRSTDLDVTL
jgi:hypothetical protein